MLHDDLDPESCVAPRGFVRRPRRFDGLGFLDGAWLEIEAGSECDLFVRRNPRLDEKQVRKAVKIPGASSGALEGPAPSGNGTNSPIFLHSRDRANAHFPVATGHTEAGNGEG